MKHWQKIVLALGSTILFASLLLAANTKLRNATIISSTLDSSPVGATTPSTGAFTTLTCTACPASIQVFSLKNLAGSVSVSATTLTAIDSITVTMPSTGGPWRAGVRYQYFKSGGVDFQALAYDGTTYFGQMQGLTSNNNSCLCGGENSPSTYANSAVITFTVYAFDNGSATIVTTPGGEGTPSKVFNGGSSHMSVSVFASN